MIFRRYSIEYQKKEGKPMKEYIVEAKNLKKYYQMGANTVKALDRFSCKRSGIRCYYRKKRVREKYTFAYAGWTGCANRRGSVGRG